MKSFKVSRWVAGAITVVAFGVTQAVVQVIGVSPASAAVPGLQVVPKTTVSNSISPKTATATCPAGKRVVGTAFELLGGQGDIILTTLRPTATTVTVNASEDQDGTTANWQIVAMAVCANPLPGIEIVTDTSAFGPAIGKNATASCPSGKQPVGTGAEIVNAPGQVSIVAVASGVTGVFAGARVDQDGYPGSWSVTAYAICANPPPGLKPESKTSSNDSSAQKVNNAVNCPAGKSALGLGWALSGEGQSFVNFAGIGATGISMVANEDDDGFAGNWLLSSTVICALT